MSKKISSPALILFSLIGLSAVDLPSAHAESSQKGPAKAATASVEVGGAQMLAERDIVDNASNSKEHTTLVTAVQTAGLVETLKGKGPFTVFAPTNEAFKKLPEGTVEGLLKPSSKSTLTGILTYHVVPESLDSKALTALSKRGKGAGTIKTVQGETLTVRAVDGSIKISDAKGNTATVTIADVHQSNGIIHVIDTVLMP